MTTALVAESALRRRSLGPPAARSVLLTVLGEYVMPLGGSVWQEALVGALAALGHSEEAARQAVARSSREGWLSGERAGRRTRMTVSAATAEMLAEGRERIYGFGRESGWDRRWLVVVLRVAENRRSVRENVRARLARAGLGPLGGGVWISPHADREPLVAAALRAAGAEGEALSFRADMASLGRPEDVVGAWNLDEVRAEYARFLDRFSALRPRGGAGLFRAHTELVHGWRRLAFLDPDLPGELVPHGWPRPPAFALFQGRTAAWRGEAQSYFADLAIS